MALTEEELVAKIAHLKSIKNKTQAQKDRLKRLQAQLVALRAAQAQAAVKFNFAHVHTSSRYDRSPQSLEMALDMHMQHSSVITMTEVSAGARLATLNEQGWAHYDTTSGDAAICWRKDIWKGQHNWTTKVTGEWRGLTQTLNGVWCATSMLKHATSDLKLMVTVGHMPAHVQGNDQQHWRQSEGHNANEYWRSRKEAYQNSMTNWSTFVKNQVKTRKPDALIVAADWNWDLKDDWFRAYMNQHWGDLGLKLAWKHFPTAGGSMDGNRIIDGSYYSGMKTEGAALLPKNPSSDHRPYIETFTMLGSGAAAAEEATGPVKFYDPVSGQTKPGIEWWGMGDYAYDEYFEIQTRLEDGTIQVTFPFNDENVPYY